MNVLMIYRHPQMGFSVGKVFKPIEEELKKIAEVDSVYMPVPNYSLMGLIANIIAARKAVKRKKYDVIHIVGTENYLIPFLKKERVVVTVHDFASLRLRKKGIRAFIKDILFIKSLKKASAVTFISKQTELEGFSLVNFDKEKCFVVHNAVDENYIYSPKELAKDKPVFLHIGIKPNKNLSRTILALNGRNASLRIIGKVKPADLALLDKYNVDYSYTYNLTDEEIYEEYKKCDIVNFPSLYEGFGMPIIEGNAVGRVVVTSNLAPMNEIANDAAVLVDPQNVESIRAGYDEALSRYAELVEKGLKNVCRYKKAEIARQYYSVYEEVLR